MHNEAFLGWAAASLALAAKVPMVWEHGTAGEPRPGSGHLAIGLELGRPNGRGYASTDVIIVTMWHGGSVEQGRDQVPDSGDCDPESRAGHVPVPFPGLSPGPCLPYPGHPAIRASFPSWRPSYRQVHGVRSIAVSYGDWTPSCQGIKRDLIESERRPNDEYLSTHTHWLSSAQAGSWGPRLHPDPESPLTDANASQPRTNTSTNAVANANLNTHARRRRKPPARTPFLPTYLQISSFTGLRYLVPQLAMKLWTDWTRRARGDRSVMFNLDFVVVLVRVPWMPLNQRTRLLPSGAATRRLTLYLRR
ncbi:hypothetical protein CEP53_012011 [Fusarium sp. AF-6]|nr:hypothetical protein CEP53_012011 [Fusarium sp. AF-6]